MTSVYEIYSRFTNLIEDTKYCKLSDRDIEDIFGTFLTNSIILFREFNNNYKPIIIENELGEKFIKKTKNNNDENIELEEMIILSYGMVISWHESQILRDKYLKQNVNTKDFNQFSNAPMLANNIELYKLSLREFTKRRRRYRNNDWSGDKF